MSASTQSARGAVLERRRSGSVGRDNAANECSRECRRRRVVASGALERRFELGKRHARLNANRFVADVDDLVQP